MMVQWIVTSCALILVVLALRAALGGHISARLRYALWLAVLVRLLIPVPLYTAPLAAAVPALPAAMEEKSIYFIPTDSAPVEDAASIGAYVLEDGQVGVSTSMGYARLEDNGETVVRYADKISPAELVQSLWALGAVLFALILLVSNLRFAAKLRRVRRPLDGTACRLPVYTANGLPSPCLFGLFRPAIYVTPQAAEDETALGHVLAHEETHYRHGDHVWSFLRCAALAIHWWNPLVWLAVVLSKRDGELACDEGALRKLGDGERRAYGETLLKLVTARTKPADLLSCATTMTGGKRSLTERIRRIACQPKYLVSVAIAVVLLSALALGCAFAGAEAPAADDGEDTPSQEGYFLQEELSNKPDLNHDGEPEDLLLMATDDKLEYGLWVTQGTDILWAGYAAQAHAGWNALFLVELDGEDYLLEYQPRMFQGVCDYSYRVFSLNEKREEIVRDERQISFDINFGQPEHSLDPEKLAFFLESVNSYLAEATELLNTDEMLLGSFLKNGRLLDTQAGWLDYDPESGVTLEEALKRYEGDWSDP